MKKKVISIILLILWMLLIFYLSSQNSQVSGSTSSYLIKNIFHIDGKLLELLHNPIREFMHFFEFLIFGILLSNVLFQFKINKNFIITIMISFIYIITDEVHQIFIPGRTFEYLDILLDLLGSIIGSKIYLSIQKNKNII